MDSQRLHDWLQVIGIAAVVASLLFVGLQIRQSDEIALAQVLEGVTARGVEERAMIAAHADTWQKACLGEQLTAKERVIAAKIYFNYAQSNFNSWLRIQQTGIGGTGGQYFVDSHATNIHRYPGFKEIALSYSGWSELNARAIGDLANEYWSTVVQRVSELEELEPNLSADVMWCGHR
jgi:hypothetical protein